MEFKSLFESYRRQIKERISEVIAEKKAEYKTRINKNSDFFDVLEEFCASGKMLRGSLFLFSAESYGYKIDHQLLNVACSLEFMHSALLIHDDIMDNDTLRRGKKTIFANYTDMAKHEAISDPNHYGISMGIIVGDIALFMAQEMATYFDSNKLQRLLQFYTRELRFVGIGQLLDYSYGAKNIEVEPDDIKRMYIDKSARYSFALPLALGGIAAGKSEDEIKTIECLGEYMGLIFQLIDDELGMFGDEKEIGKPVGSDIQENKKTFMRSILMKKAKTDDKVYLESIFGNKAINISEIENVRKLIVDLGVLDEVKQMINELYDDSKAVIEKLNVYSEFKNIYLELLDYNTKRKY